MAELTPLTEADLDTYLMLIGEHGALAATPARGLIAELRALREAVVQLTEQEIKTGTPVVSVSYPAFVSLRGYLPDEELV